MPRKETIYTVQDATGTATELYNWIAAGIKNKPTLAAFTTRLRRGERSPSELRRPPQSFSSAGTEARRQGLRRYHEKRKDMSTEKPTAGDILQDKVGQQEAIKLTYGREFFRPGSLDAWPRLKEAFLKGWR